VLAAGRAAWVDEFALSLPQGYDTPLGESGAMLSGGQRRRVALARAVVSTAPVVLLDEPTTSLDAEAARQVVGAIRSATRDRTVLLVTHDPVLAAIADRTVTMSPHRPPTSPRVAIPAGNGRPDGAARGRGVHRDAGTPSGAPQSGGRGRGRALVSTTHHETSRGGEST
jgi:energy-coupling factor transporter ATP-binding protein EcfA2